MTAPHGAPREAGRELDRRIAVEVMGWQIFPYMMGAGNEFSYCPPGERPHVSAIRSVPAYSTDIAAAWLVVEHFRGPKGATFASPASPTGRRARSSGRLAHVTPRRKTCHRSPSAKPPSPHLPPLTRHRKTRNERTISDDRRARRDRL